MLMILTKNLTKILADLQQDPGNLSPIYCDSPFAANNTSKASTGGFGDAVEEVKHKSQFYKQKQTQKGTL